MNSVRLACSRGPQGDHFGRAHLVGRGPSIPACHRGGFYSRRIASANEYTSILPSTRTMRGRATWVSHATRQAR